MEQIKKRGTEVPPLKGVTILDLTNETASFATRLLLDFGALVIRIEPPGCEEQQNMAFLYHNAGKERITLDLAQAEGRQIFLRLAQQSDVILETFGCLDPWGIGYEWLSKENQGLIVVSVTGFGLNGGKQQERTDDLILSAASGMMSISGEAGQPPLRLSGGQTGYITSLNAAVSVILALIERRSTKRGRHIDLSAQEAALGALDYVLPQYLYQGAAAKRQGSIGWHRRSFLLPCADGTLLVHISAAQWDTLVEWMDGEEMAADLKEPQWKEEAFRQAHIDHIIEVLSRWTKGHTVQTLFETAQQMRFAWTVVTTPAEVCQNPQLRDRCFFRTFEAADYRSILTPGMPCRSEAFPTRQNERLARPGEHNEAVYCGRLQMTPAELDQMRRRRVI